MKFDSNWYRYSEGDKANWTDAEFECYQRSELVDAHLVSIHSAEEQKFVRDNFQNNIWLGGSDVDEEGSWVWTDFSEWDYSVWRENEPSDSGSGEHCLAFSGDLNCNDLIWRSYTVKSRNTSWGWAGLSSAQAGIGLFCRFSYSRFDLLVLVGLN